ncbi:hypothetical protein MHBO_004079 [Bonamia ostreae]|uniref:Uncharacterized protein n=1 Tax=Bonamia ostreae TaxID=126728 RepID=A0ABV2ASB4_9EUKA
MTNDENNGTKKIFETCKVCEEIFCLTELPSFSMNEKEKLKIFESILINLEFSVFFERATKFLHSLDYENDLKEGINRIFNLLELAAKFGQKFKINGVEKYFVKLKPFFEEGNLKEKFSSLVKETSPILNI